MAKRKADTTATASRSASIKKQKSTSTGKAARKSTAAALTENKNEKQAQSKSNYKAEVSSKVFLKRAPELVLDITGHDENEEQCESQHLLDKFKLKKMILPDGKFGWSGTTNADEKLEIVFLDAKGDLKTVFGKVSIQVVVDGSENVGEREEEDDGDDAGREQDEDLEEGGEFCSFA